MDKREFLSFIADGEDIISFRKSYVDITDSLIAGMMLNEIIFWHLPNRETGQSKLRVIHEDKEWLAISKVDWYNRARITSSQARTGENRLIELGFINVRVFKFNGVPTTHYSLNWDFFLNTFEQHISRASQMDLQEIANGNDENSKSLTALTTSLTGSSIPSIPNDTIVESESTTRLRLDINTNVKNEKASFSPLASVDSMADQFNNLPPWVHDLKLKGYPDRKKLNNLLKIRSELQVKSALEYYIAKHGDKIPHWSAALNAATKFFVKDGNTFDFNVQLARQRKQFA